MIVCSGDMLPNQTRGNRIIEPKFQKSWVVDHLDEFVAWIGGKTFFLCRGNHDFFDPTPILRSAGIAAYDITEKYKKFNGLNFYGFPFIPYMDNEWSFELLPQPMIEKVDQLSRRINDGTIDILVAHCPIYGILDRRWDDGRSYGNSVMKNAFEYKIDVWPKAYLCGHMHEDNGLAELANPANPDEIMIISNAATTTRIIEV